MIDDNLEFIVDRGSTGIRGIVGGTVVSIPAPPLHHPVLLWRSCN